MTQCNNVGDISSVPHAVLDSKHDGAKAMKRARLASQASTDVEAVRPIKRQTSKTNDSRQQSMKAFLSTQSGEQKGSSNANSM